MASMTHGLTIGSGKLTYDDLANVSDESKRYEILDGDLAVTPSPATRHQRVSGNLGSLLHAHVREHGLGWIYWVPTDVILDVHTVVVPDILFVSTARAAIVQPHAVVGPPDLLVEILSPSTAHRDKGVKAKLYARFGVEHFWLVDPAECVLETFHAAPGTPDAYVTSGRHAGNALVRTDPFPDLTIQLAKIWD